MIRRRDFLGGVSLMAASGTFLSPFELMALSGGTSSSYYPPKLTGMRGSHAGSFEVAHSVAWDGKDWGRPGDQTDDTYDLIVVGGGISGLASAYLFQKHHDWQAKVLILDNHDDFGGHAKRNEFNVGGKTLIGYGGSQSIDSPATYSEEAIALIKELSIEVERFYGYFDRDFYARRGLTSGIYFEEKTYGKAALTPDAIEGGLNIQNAAAAVGDFPISNEGKAALIRLISDKTDHFVSLSDEEKKTKLRSLSYMDYVKTVMGLPDDAANVMRDRAKGLWGVGYDAISTLEAANLSMPGTAAYAYLIGHYGSGEPYIFHFPDGNAGIARMMVRKLVPKAAGGDTMEDIVKTKLDYSQLDSTDNKTRIRLNATATDIRNSVDGKYADVCYVKAGKTYRSRAKHVIAACYNHILPHICPEMPSAQIEAIGYAKKVPLVYTNIALRNWQSFADIGYHHVSIPQSDMHHSFALDFPVSMGGYDFSQNPDEPILVHGSYVPAMPDKGLVAREQHVAGRYHLYSLKYEDFEASILDQMSGILKGTSFDAERDIAAITVNRWPHGYAYEYNDYADPADWGPSIGPHILGRKQMGRISIANSDASAYAYVNGAIDAAVRAVKEQVY